MTDSDRFSGFYAPWGLVVLAVNAKAGDRTPVLASVADPADPDGGAPYRTARSGVYGVYLPLPGDPVPASKTATCHF